MNPTLLRVTQRIIERSKETRSAYLARIEQAKTQQQQREVPCSLARTSEPSTHVSHHPHALKIPHSLPVSVSPAICRWPK